MDLEICGGTGSKAVGAPSAAFPCSRDSLVRPDDGPSSSPEPSAIVRRRPCIGRTVACGRAASRQRVIARQPDHPVRHGRGDRRAAGGGPAERLLDAAGIVVIKRGARDATCTPDPAASGSGSRVATAPIDAPTPRCRDAFDAGFPRRLVRGKGRATRATGWRSTGRPCRVTARPHDNSHRLARRSLG